MASHLSGIAILFYLGVRMILKCIRGYWNSVNTTWQRA